MHLRPFFPSAADFAAATTPHFQFLIDEFGYSEPVIEGHGATTFGLRYDGKATSVLLNWDVEGGFFACNLVPRLPTGEIDPDFERWLSPNEIVAARGAPDEPITQGELEDVDETGYARTMARQAAILRAHCADVLRGDWSIFDEAHHWFARHANA